MPITLYILKDKIPNKEGTAFGILTVGLFIGYLPTYLNIARNLSASKQQAQAANRQTINAIQEEFGGRLTAEAAADAANDAAEIAPIEIDAD